MSSSSSRRTGLERLIKNRFRSNRDVRRILDSNRKQQTNIIDQQSYLTGVYRGQFYRIKVPPEKRSLPNLPKLPNPQMKPVSFQTGSSTPSVSINTAASSALSSPTSTNSAVSQISHNHARDGLRSTSSKQLQQQQKTKGGSWQEWQEAAFEWWKTNWAVLVFNFGSICTLVGFTRSDVLELRSLSVTGSLSAVLYNLVQTPFRLPPILWSGTFAAVNATKIYQILQERGATVHLTARQEAIYVQHFLPHGVTPKQFEALDAKAETIHLPKGSFLIRQGDKLDYVFLVVEGVTQASILGRHLTAASTTPTAHQDRLGGASGAWVGEMAFLETYWIKEQSKRNPATTAVEEREQDGKAIAVPHKDPSAAHAVAAATKKETTKLHASEVAAAAAAAPPPLLSDEKKLFVPPEQRQPPIPKSTRAMYSIRAKEDCTVLRWSHADMEALCARSTDMRAALTRAMTAAIVAKVINFTVSRGKPTWSSWLTDWKYAGGTIRVNKDGEEEEEEHAGEDDEDADIRNNAKSDALPTYSIKKFS